ncbi:MAG TPA: SHOCT domain-containing protein [Candidatus Acidoferrales bacterium]|nr:SHOCT domain-containing protein [Candidatus Acidoferrales bacterium]
MNSRKQIPINKAFVLLVFAIATLLVGCGTTARTVSAKEAVEMRAAIASKPKIASNSPKNVGQGNTNDLEKIYEHPVYDIPLSQAWPIVRETLSKFCDGKLKKIDESNHRLEGINRNVWEGDTYVMVDLLSDQQRTVVQIAVRDYGLNRNIITRSPHILDLFIDRLNAAMKKVESSHGDAAARLQTLEDLKAKGLITDEEYRSKRTAILGGL